MKNIAADTDYGFAGGEWMNRKMKDPHRHNEIELNYIAEGSLTYLFSGKEIELQKTDCALFWAALPHQIITHKKDTLFFWFTIPLGTFLSWQLSSTFIQSLMSGELIQDSQLGKQWGGLFESWSKDINKEDPLRSIVMLEMESQIRRLEIIISQAKQKDPEKSDKKAKEKKSVLPQKLIHMIHYISQHDHQPVTIPEIATSCGLHPNYAMTLFKKHMGRSLKQYLMQQRLAHAQRLLATTDATILEVALNSGFNSPSRFYEAFQKHCRETPRAYRKRLQK